MSTWTKVFVKEWGILLQCYLLFINFICWNNLNPCMIYLKIHVVYMWYSFITRAKIALSVSIFVACSWLGHMGKLMCCMWLHAQIFIWFWEFHYLKFDDSYYNVAWFIQTTLILNSCLFIEEQSFKNPQTILMRLHMTLLPHVVNQLVSFQRTIIVEIKVPWNFQVQYREIQDY